MDLITAKVEAAAQSKQNSSIVYINIIDEECELSNVQDNTTYTAFKNGKEVEVGPAEDTPIIEESVIVVNEEKAKGSKQPKPKKEKAPKKEAPVKTISQPKKEVMSKEKKAPAKKKVGAAKKVVKKTAVKKEAPSKKVEKAKGTGPAWKQRANGEIPRGSNLYLSPAEWKKVDAIVGKTGESYNAWLKSLVRSKLK